VPLIITSRADQSPVLPVGSCVQDMYGRHGAHVPHGGPFEEPCQPAAGGSCSPRVARTHTASGEPHRRAPTATATTPAVEEGQGEAAAAAAAAAAGGAAAGAGRVPALLLAAWCRCDPAPHPPCLTQWQDGAASPAVVSGVERLCCVHLLGLDLGLWVTGFEPCQPNSYPLILQPLLQCMLQA